jgi:hypothetical protein
MDATVQQLSRGGLRIGEKARLNEFPHHHTRHVLLLFAESSRRPSIQVGK